MSDYIDSFIEKNKPIFQKYERHLKNNNWTLADIDSDLKDAYFNDLYSEDKKKSTNAQIQKRVKEYIAAQRANIDFKSQEFKLQNDLISNLLDRLKYFIKKSGEHTHPKFKRFVKYSLSVIQKHIDRVNSYVDSVDISKIDNQEVRSEEMKLMKDCYAAVNKLQDTIDGLNIKEDGNTEGIVFLDTQKATLAMHKDLSGQYSEIKPKLEKLGIDFDSPPPPTIHILNPNPPKWNTDLNYWEQEKETLQYYVDEYKKIDYGVEIDGYYFDGWLYFHFNYFVTNIPTTVIKGGVAENEDVVRVPELRDNEILINSYFIKSRKEQLMSLIAATRRAAKTTMNASRIARAKILGRKQILCAGGSAEDLGHIKGNLKTCDDNINPAFKLYELSPTEDGKGVAYGIKTKANKSKVISNVFIINLEGGSTSKKKETLAGFTPDEFILDEAMKFPYKKQLEALEPALWGMGVLRTSCLITGTGGDENLAKDAINMLNDPKGNRVCLMDWDELERGLDEEDITWNRKEFGLFLPTQMCIKHPKIKSNLAEYLGIDSDTLRQIPLWITNWKEAKIREQEEREAKSKNRESYVRLLAYHPFDPTEIFLSGKVNPFPLEEAKAHKQAILADGDTGKKVFLIKDASGKIEAELSTKELANYPHKGGFIDAPVTLYMNIPEVKPPMYMFVAGLDDYKQDESGTDSVGSFHIKMIDNVPHPMAGQIVASYSSRPDPHKKFHRQGLLLLQAFNARVFMENEDMSFKEYLDRERLTDYFLVEAMDFSTDMNDKYAGRRRYGWTPNVKNKKFLFSMFKDFCWKEIETTDKDGNPTTILGVQTIKDVGLLEEIIQYQEGANVDRITSMMSCLGYEYYLFVNNMFPNIRKLNQGQEEEKKKPAPQKNMAQRFFGSRPYNSYFR